MKEQPNGFLESRYELAQELFEDEFGDEKVFTTVMVAEDIRPWYGDSSAKTPTGVMVRGKTYPNPDPEERKKAKVDVPDNQYHRFPKEARYFFNQEIGENGLQTGDIIFIRTEKHPNGKRLPDGVEILKA